MFKNTSKETSSFDWSGPYLGANLGYGTNQSTVHFHSTVPSYYFGSTPPNALATEDAGFIAGGQLGYNWKINSQLLGIEWDWDYAHISSANATVSRDGLTTTASKNLKWFSSIRGRVGQRASDRILMYISAGPIWGKTNFMVSRNIDWYVPEDFDSNDISTTKLGWSAGTGIEYAVSNRTTYKLEYLYMDLGSTEVNLYYKNVLKTLEASSRFNSNIIRFGMNYKL